LIDEITLRGVIAEALIGAAIAGGGGATIGALLGGFLAEEAK